MNIPKWIVIGCLCLAFTAGFVNSITVLGFVGNSVSHVTGTVTVAAELLAKGDVAKLYKVFSILLFFVLGAAISGLLVKDESLKLGRNYGYALLIESGFILMSIILFMNNSFWGELFASLACGLQNALVTTFSGTVIRTTHLTGIVTDLGSSLGMMLSKNKFDISKVKLQFSILIGFSFGAFCATFMFLAYGFLSLFLPFFTVLFLGLLYIFYVNKFEEKS